MSFEEKLRSNLQELYPGMGKVKEASPAPQGSSETNPTVNKAVKGGGSDSVKKAGDSTVLSPSSGGRDEKPHPQGDSEPNPAKEDLGADEPGKVAAAKAKKGPVPTNKGAGKGHGTTDTVDPTSVVNQASSKGNVVREDTDLEEDEVITEDEFNALSPEEQEEWELVEFEDDLDEEISDEELDEFLESLDEDELDALLEELESEEDEDEEEVLEEGNKENKAKKNAYATKKGENLLQGKLANPKRVGRKALQDGKGIDDLKRIKNKAAYTIAMRKESIDLNFDPAVLFEGDDTLTEEFKTKAASLFEAVVTAKVTELRHQLEEEAAELATEALAEHLDNLVTVMDNYLTEAALEWIAQNELAVENGLRTEITENFIHGLKSLFEESYIDVPDERLDIVAELAQEIEDLKEELQQTNELAEEVVAELHQVKREEILRTVSEGLALTQADKLKTLTEDVTFEDAESFEAKLIAIRENFFNSRPEEKPTLTETKVVDDSIARLADLMPKSATFSK